jgi:hypothetical protein
MSFRYTHVRRTAYILIVATALSLLLLVTVAGEVWHHHDAVNSHCPFCSLSHQVAASAAQGQGVAAPERLGILRAAQDPFFVPTFCSPQLSTRAPPSA